jgi:hypothetical protein
MTLKMGAARQIETERNPTCQSGALLAKWTMQILSADKHATLLLRSNATLFIIDYFLPAHTTVAQPVDT